MYRGVVKNLLNFHGSGKVDGSETSVAPDLRVCPCPQQESQKTLIAEDDRPTQRCSAAVREKSYEQIWLSSAVAVSPGNQFSSPHEALWLANLIDVCPALEQQLCHPEFVARVAAQCDQMQRRGTGKSSFSPMRISSELQQLSDHVAWSSRGCSCMDGTKSGKTFDLGIHARTMPNQELHSTFCAAPPQGRSSSHGGVVGIGS